MKTNVWNQLTSLPFLPLYSKVVTASLELDVYSHLEKRTTAKALASEMGWHENNTAYLLSALTSIGFLEKEGDDFYNSAQAAKYLVKGKKTYLGGFLLYYIMNEGMIPMDVKQLVTEGPQPMAQRMMDDQLNFSQYGALLRQAQQGYREQEILQIIRALPENKQIHKILDMGCATGLLGLAVIQDEKEREGVLFDQLPASLIQSSLDMAGLTDRVKVVSGNFMTDDLGQGYDLIMAVSVMLFAKGQMEGLLKKCYDALNPDGVLVVISEGILDDVTGPWDMVMGYLPYYFQGMDMGVKKDEVVSAAKKAGFTRFEKKTELLCSGNQDIDIIRK